jgi:hypothetical protein
MDMLSKYADRHYLNLAGLKQSELEALVDEQAIKPGKTAEITP